MIIKKNGITLNKEYIFNKLFLSFKNIIIKFINNNMNKILIFGIIAFILLMIGLGLFSYFMCYSKEKGYICNPFDNKPGAVSVIKIVKVESFTDKIQLQMQDDQTYKIYWPDVSNKGTGDPAKFFYQYYVWKGSHPTFTSSSPSPDQTDKTVSPSFILNPDLYSSPEITVIVTANNEFGASADALQTFNIKQAPSINSVQFNNSASISAQGLFVSNPVIDIELSSLGGGSNATVSSFININRSGNLLVKIPQTKCNPVSNMKAQCFFDIPSKDLYGGNEFIPNAFAQNSIGKSSIISGTGFGQPRIFPDVVTDIQIKDVIMPPNPIPENLSFRIKYKSQYITFFPKSPK